MEEYFSSHVCNKVCIELGLHKKAPVTDVLRKLRAQICDDLALLGGEVVAPEAEPVQLPMDPASLDVLQQLHTLQLSKTQDVRPAGRWNTAMGKMNAADAAKAFVDVVDGAGKNAALALGMQRASIKKQKRRASSASPSQSPRMTPEVSVSILHAPGVCRSFACLGFCPKGDDCRFQHAE